MGADCSSLSRNPEVPFSGACQSAYPSVSVFPAQVSSAASCQLVDEKEVHQQCALTKISEVSQPQERLYGSLEEKSMGLENLVTAVVKDDGVKLTPSAGWKRQQHNAAAPEAPSRSEDDSYASLEEAPTALCCVLRTTSSSCRQNVKPMRVSVASSVQLDATNDDVSVSMDPCLCAPLTTDFRTSTSSNSVACCTSTFERHAGDVINFASEA